MLDQELQLKE